MNLTYILSIVIIFAILSFLVIIHELGHLFAAWWAKVKAEEFGVGYPPRALKLFTWRGTLFSLNWIPVGGFVRMEGEEGYQEEKVSKSKSKAKSKSSVGPFYSKSAWQRLVIILAGPVINLLFGILAFTIVYSVLGIPSEPPARISQVQESSPAATAGIPAQVEIISLRDDQETIAIGTISQAIAAIEARQGQNVTVVTTGPCDDQGCQELAQEFSVYVRRQDELQEGEGFIGIAFDTTPRFTFYPWYQMPFRAMAIGFQQSYQLAVLILRVLGTMIFDAFRFGKLPDQLVGPVGIAAQAGEMELAHSGWLDMLNLAGLISINLGVVNLLPIAPLDGGRALFILLGKIFDRRRLAEWETRINYGGMIFLLGLLVLITLSDVLRIFRG